ncbi:C40 family peptidase [Roseburia sp. MSJ-14]|uniref:C40 family peptidase n=1 Tax=Roseburia sp. MSJ-14 TaxID=2841514 RepID=UPI001C12185E|nr:C40 family peptidase [Roseburia sp. MSJ-14]MBU5474644.1 C40 family peptidase [Roseburia sp. MSJ-14]
MKSKRLAAALLVVVLCFSQFTVAFANKKTDAQNKKKEAEENLDKKNEEIDKIQKEQQSIQNEIDQLDSQLVQVMIDLSTLEEELATKQDELAQTQEELAQAQADEANQYEAMKKRIQFMYENGDSTMITSFLEADNISDMLNRVEYFNEMYSYDRQLLVTYQQTKEQVAALKQQQETEVAQLQQTQADYQTAATNYQNTIAKKQNSMDGFGEKLKQAQALAAQYQDTISEQNTVIAKEEEREAQEREQAARAAAQAAANQNNNSHSGTGSSSGNSGGNSNTGSSGGQNLNPAHTTSVSGSAVVQYALNFVGNPYVWGGKDPNTGADCSGFTSYVYGHFGISIPSYSYAQRSVGQEVSYENAQPGDLICYAGHVAIYMGNGQIVHAKGTAYGIVAYDNATYRPIITVRRVL